MIVTALEASDVIVHVSFAHSPALNGYLTHQLSAAGSHRYLRVVLKARLSNRESIPVLLMSSSMRWRWRGRPRSGIRRP